MRNPGLSDHYHGDRGVEYARYQLDLSAGMGLVKARPFRAFIRYSDTVLDFGCGGGDILLALKCGDRFGVEPSEAARAMAISNGIESVPILADIPDARVDVVITHHALEHCTRPLDELREMRRVLKPEGRLIVLVPLDDWRTQRTYNSTDINHHLYAWTPQLLGNLLADAGFHVERLDILTHAWPPFVRTWARLPEWAFDAVCFSWSFLRRRRQMLTVCHPL